MRFLFMGISLMIALAGSAFGQQQRLTPCEEVRNGLASQIATQATMLTEQARMIEDLQRKVTELTPKKEEKKP